MSQAEHASFPSLAALSCVECGAALPAGLLVASDEESGEFFHLLAAKRHRVGRGARCELKLAEELASVSRIHARLDWNGWEFLLLDNNSANGTFVNDRQLESDESVPIRNGDRIRFGDLVFTFYTLRAGGSGTSSLSYELFLRLIGEISSLETATVVSRSLDLLRAVSGTERAFLISAGSEPRLAPLMSSIDDPSLELSRANIQKALEERRKVVVSLGPDSDQPPTPSMANLRLKKIWISPITDASGRPLAAVYLDSTHPGQSPESTTEKLMEAVVQQISLALRNALLHADVVDLNVNLEEKVSERTRQLEQSRAELIARDRLATMGRLVAAIAHELNNPVGAIASLADTMNGMRDELLGTTLEISRELPEPADNDAALALLGAAVRSATEDRLDTHRRRELEAHLSKYLAERKVPSAGHLAHRLARAGLTENDLEGALSPLKQKGDFLSSQVEKVHKFARGLGTIGDCAEHVARIVDGLKTYTHLDRSELVEADIHQGLQATLAVLASRTPPDVKVETRFADIAPFPHHPGQLTQVWTNLVDNALGAMGESGALTITTRNAGDHVVVEIADTGSGIPEEIREQIFDLHVTTRGPGAGLGLGLPICRSIIEDKHGGTIGVESEPGRTVFTVTIPKEPPAPGEPPQ